MAIPNGSWAGPDGVKPIHDEHPPNDVRPSFQMICGGSASTCQASPIWAGPRAAFPQTPTDRGAGAILLARPFIRSGGPLSAPRCASSQVCISDADDLISGAS